MEVGLSPTRRLRGFPPKNPHLDCNFTDSRISEGRTRPILHISMEGPMANPIARIEKVLREEIDVYSGLYASRNERATPLSIKTEG